MENIWGKHSVSDFAHHLTTEAEEFPRTTLISLQFYVKDNLS